MARSNLVTWAFILEKVKTVNFSETIAASDLKVRRSRHLIEYMKVCEYRRSRSFLNLGPRSCTYRNSNRIFSNYFVDLNQIWLLTDVTRTSKNDAKVKLGDMNEVYLR